LNVPKIGIVISSTRQGRFADKPAAWFKALADKRDRAVFEALDLRDYPLQFFDEAIPPAHSPPTHAGAVPWANKLREFDGFVVITAEYNHAPTGMLKNALDYAYKEYVRKPIGFVGYGGVGAARAIEQLRLIAIELKLVPIQPAVHICRTEFVAIRQGKNFDEFPFLGQSVEILLDEIIWWSALLKIARAADAPPKS
jgi:NAD(P)H-dependent FMN reductase